MADDSGTVSGLLFTDLEGSTAHLRALSDRYGEVLARHNEIIRSAVTEAGGTEVGAEGDSIAALFPSPAAGVRAAIAAQRALATEPWPDSPWRVRMAVHAGVVETTGAGAIGIGLHEAARLRNIAHGGQIVVSEAAATHGVDAQLTDLGLHNVRDFATPVRIHQVKATGLDDSFPPLRTSAGRDIPRAATPFIGRVDELEALLTVLSTSQIVTLTGAGGSGKTRLAYEVARRVETPWIVVVELAGLRDPSQVEGQIATRVGVGDPSAIASAIGERELLLVMDNCEHVVDAAASIVASLASVCTNLSVLATSREPLHVTGERVWPVPVLQPREASELFQSRAQTRRDEALIATMCERLGWMPLAIELAAARVRSMPLDQLVSRLDDQLRVLTTGARDIPRQQTLRATLDWSHQLLTYDEGVVFRRVGVFAGGFTLPAAEAVAVVPTDVDVPRALDGLVMKSLVDFTPEGRYRMLEPVRQYAIERLQEAGEEERVLEGHLRWVTHIATDTARQLFVDRESVDVLDHERDNVGAAIGWAFDTGRLVQSTNLVSRLAWYWFTSGRSESYVWLPRLLDQVDSLEIRDRGKALLAAGISECDIVEHYEPIEWLREAESIFRGLGNERALGSALFWLGRALAIRDEFEEAEPIFLEAVELHDRLGDTFGWGWCRSWLGLFERRRGNLDSDEAIQLEVLERGELAGIPHVVGAALGELAHVAGARGDAPAAISFETRALELYREMGDRWQTAAHLSNLAGFHMQVTPERAATLLAEALELFVDLVALTDVRRALEGAACCLFREGRVEEAAFIVGAVDQETFLISSSEWLTTFDELVKRLREVTSDPTWASTVERGRRTDPREAALMAAKWLSGLYPASADTSV